MPVLVSMKNKITALSAEYKKWLTDLKARVRQLQLKAAVSVNRELLTFYWELGADIVEKEQKQAWGSGFMKRLSVDLMTEFPQMTGFSKRNLEQIRRWYSFWSQSLQIAKQPASQLQAIQEALFLQIPWWHNVVIVTQCKTLEEALYYVRNTVAYGWSRAVLVHQIESGLWQREGKAITNFSQTLPAVQSDLARQTLKDPYVFDFLTLTKEHDERELEQNLTQHITQFLLELGSGFAYVGKQVSLQVGERDFFIDLLFYHTQLHCYVAIELKTGDFEPEHVGKLNFYLKAVDEQLRKPVDNASIGILLCKSKDRIVAEYALSDVHKPIGISAYQFTQELPLSLKGSLPSIEQIEEELMNK